MATQIAQTTEELGIEDPEEYRAETRERLQRAIDEETGQLDEEQEKALEALTNADADTTVSVPINDERTVEVKTYINRAIEERFDAISAAKSWDDVADKLVECIVWLIEDDDYSDEAVWREYRRLRGTTGLYQMFERISEPALNAIQGRDAAGNLHGTDGGS